VAADQRLECQNQILQVLNDQSYQQSTVNQGDGHNVYLSTVKTHGDGQNVHIAKG